MATGGMGDADDKGGASGWECEFTAALVNQSLDKANGALVLTFQVEPGSKYDVMPITDIRGRTFKIYISTASSRVFAGKEGIEAARRRVKERAAERGEAIKTPRDAFDE